jgi:hypothetical protein
MTSARSPVLDDLLEDHDLAGVLEGPDVDDVQRLVEHDLLAGPQGVGVDGRAQGDAQLLPGRHDVRGAVAVLDEERREPARRLAEPVDLGLEGDDLLTGIAQRGDEPLVVVLLRRQLATNLVQGGLQAPDPRLQRFRLGHDASR